MGQVLRATGTEDHPSVKRSAPLPKTPHPRACPASLAERRRIHRRTIDAPSRGIKFICKELQHV